MIEFGECVRQRQMSSPIVFMFAGQGSQYFQMGRGLYESGGTFARWMKYLDTFVLETFGRSVLKALYGDHEKSDPFVDTPLSHPAIFMVEVALAYELIERGIYPDMTLGVSMGSFAAAAVAGNLRVEDALTLVVRQADALVDHCSEGGMIAVLAKAHLYQQESLRRYSVIAAYNFESHFALSALTTFLKYLLPANAGSSFYSVLTPYGRDLDNLSSLVTAVNGKKNRRIARWLP
jgi:acyl transferase domain-containing protein